MKTSIMAASVLVMSISGLAIASIESPYIIDARILTLPAEGELQVWGDQGKLLSGVGDDTIVFGGIDEIRVGDIVLSVGEDGNLLLPDGSGVEMLAAPRISTMPDQAAEVTVGSTVQFFSKDDDGRWSLNHTAAGESPGLYLTCTPHHAEDDSVMLDFALRLTVMQDREEIPGLRLDVGRPIVQTSETASTLLLAPDRWALIRGLMFEENGGDGNILLLLLKVRRS